MALVSAHDSRVAQAVMDRWGLRDRGGNVNKHWWREFCFESGWSRMENKLTMAEWEEFLRVCGEAGVAPSNELRVFRSVLGMISRYGDDGYGDRPADMSRIVYWFQHVGNVPQPRPEVTPEILQAAARTLAREPSRTRPSATDDPAILKRRRAEELRGLCRELAVEEGGTKAQMIGRILAVRPRQCEPGTASEPPTEPAMEPTAATESS